MIQMEQRMTRELVRIERCITSTFIHVPVKILKEGFPQGGVMTINLLSTRSIRRQNALACEGRSKTMPRHHSMRLMFIISQNVSLNTESELSGSHEMIINCMDVEIFTYLSISTLLIHNHVIISFPCLF